MGFISATLKPFLLILFILVHQLGIAQHNQVEEQIRNGRWEIHIINKGAIWKYHHFDDLFNSKQSINILDIDLNNDKVVINIPHIGSGFLKTSAMAEQAGAFAAVNGSFFNTKIGGSVVFFRKNEKILKHASEDFPTYRDNAGFAIDSLGQALIITKPEKGWELSKYPSTILSSGPLLVYNGKPVPQASQNFNTNRHPRTAIGITKDNHLIAVTIDGRTSQAHGMTMEQLAALMYALDCTDAMNLDGGGSSTLWIKGQPFNGVVNFPSDNKNFDHEGERPVANCIVFIYD
jgi:exopolysaccharide biosynthesis protein